MGNQSLYGRGGGMGDLDIVCIYENKNLIKLNNYAILGNQSLIIYVYLFFLSSDFYPRQNTIKH